MCKRWKERRFALGKVTYLLLDLWVAATKDCFWWNLDVLQIISLFSSIFADFSPHNTRIDQFGNHYTGNGAPNGVVMVRTVWHIYKIRCCHHFRLFVKIFTASIVYELVLKSSSQSSTCLSLVSTTLFVKFSSLYVSGSLYQDAFESFLQCFANRKYKLWKPRSNLTFQ